MVSRSETELMKIVFHKLSYKNFLSAGNAPIEIDLEAAPKNLIIGSNGNGKSSMEDALHFCLYGSAFRNINKGMLVNSINKKKCLVEVTFSVAGHDYKVVRGIAPVVFDIFKDGEIIPHDANSRDYQEKLETNILGGMTSKLFQQVVVLGSANYVPFMQLTAADRRSVVENMLDMNVFYSMSGMLKEYISDVRTRYNVCEHQDVSLKSILDKHISWSKDYDKRKEEEQHAYNQKLETEQRLLHAAESQLADMEAENEAESLDDLKRDLLDKQNVLMEKKGDNESTKKSVDRDLKFFVEHENCPTCHQSIEPDFKTHKISELQNESDKLDKTLKLIAEVKIKLDSKLKDIRDKEELRRSYERQRNALLSTISGHKAKVSSLIENDPSKKTEDKDQFVKIIENTQLDIEKNKQELDSIILEMESCKILSAMLKDTGVKSHMVKKYIPMINVLINKYLEELGFFVQFTIDEQFNEVIKSRYRDTFSYNSFSQGEKLRIDVALLFAWRALMRSRNSVTTNILIMDEVLDGSIDSSGAEDFLHLLDEVAKDSNVFIISHRGDTLADKFDRILKFEKQGNYSSVEIQ